MAWVVLICSGLLEAAWATALSASEGLRRPRPAALFFVSLLGSMAGLAYAMTAIPTGTSYAVWTGIGAATTVVLALARGQERASVWRMLLLLLLVGSVVGLKVVS